MLTLYELKYIFKVP